MNNQTNTKCAENYEIMDIEFNLNNSLFVDATISNKNDKYFIKSINDITTKNLPPNEYQIFKNNILLYSISSGSINNKDLTYYVKCTDTSKNSIIIDNSLSIVPGNINDLAATINIGNGIYDLKYKSSTMYISREKSDCNLAKLYIQTPNKIAENNIKFANIYLSYLSSSNNINLEMLIMYFPIFIMNYLRLNNGKLKSNDNSYLIYFGVGVSLSVVAIIASSIAYYKYVYLKNKKIIGYSEIELKRIK
jgi:hypothetical protein